MRPQRGHFQGAVPDDELDPVILPHLGPQLGDISSYRSRVTLSIFTLVPGMAGTTPAGRGTDSFAPCRDSASTTTPSSATREIINNRPQLAVN
ncbi:hypothetical protein [Streptomyces sp. NPDC001410]|uniref:hypothetical protein n=1 Tax=Streptomyces sp. NPDC001410 TaxID=3364574 RepID=UPI0036A796FD